MRRLQIGVMGSAADLKYAKSAEDAAMKLGELIARRNGVLVFGAEKDYDSLSTSACRGAKKVGGLVVGVTYNKRKDIWQKDVDVIIPCGSDRGGGREFVVTLTCDAIIAIGGGSGTLNEVAVAYQADIPIIALKGFGGWADELSNRYLDKRKRRKVLAASTPEKTVALAFREAELYAKRYG